MSIADRVGRPITGSAYPIESTHVQQKPQAEMAKFQIQKKVSSNLLGIYSHDFSTVKSLDSAGGFVRPLSVHEMALFPLILFTWTRTQLELFYRKGCAT